MNNKIKKSKGFTLTELIVVIVIIGILAAVLIPTLTGYIKKANQSADEQEVAMLNKIALLFEYEEKPNSINELKQVLKENGYSGDYSLRVDDSYLWYDTKINKFIIIDEKDFPSNTGNLVSLSTVDSSKYKITSNLVSPEGLLNNEGKEVWLLGGKGDLLLAVNEIRNIGNTGQDLQYFSKIANENIKNSLKTLFENYAFVGENGKFVIDNDGKVSEYNDDNGDIKYIYSELSDESISLFHKEVIKANIQKIQDKLQSSNAPVKIEVNDEYEVKITLTAQNGIRSATGAVLDVINILKENNCLSGYIFPAQFIELDDYTDAISIVYDEYQNIAENLVNNEEYKFQSEIISENLFNLITQYYNQIESVESLYKINLTTLNVVDGTVDATAIDKFTPALLTALNIYMNNETKLYDAKSTVISSASAFENKNDLILIGDVKSDKYGDIQIKYTFSFSVEIE